MAWRNESGTQRYLARIPRAFHTRIAQAERENLVPYPRCIPPEIARFGGHYPIAGFERVFAATRASGPGMWSLEKPTRAEVACRIRSPRIRLARSLEMAD